uniref:Mitochondrial import inner membrane translocase subunit Tim21 n=1 Tax=Angiostrongylus cantonensis TaxID=6313 RepID=A0A0K0CW29_ANGCA
LRSFSRKEWESAEKIDGQHTLQRTVLEEVLVKEKAKPMSFTGKASSWITSAVTKSVTEKASNTILYAAVAGGLGILGVFIYLLAREFLAEGSPQKVYSKRSLQFYSALALIRRDESCQELFGPTIAGYGEETSRGRRRHVAHHEYQKDGKQRIRVLFHLKGERNEGIAQAEMEQQDGKWQWRFLYVETKIRPKTTHVLIDNR